MESIQPTQSASSTASDQVTLGLPEAFLYEPCHNSAAVSWFASNQSRSSAGVEKKIGSGGGLGATDALVGAGQLGPLRRLERLLARQFTQPVDSVDRRRMRREEPLRALLELLDRV